jgi:glucosamine--fructose-6-phosphate aminotransferase (isomerizing)
MPALPIDLAKISRLTIVACGTAYLAVMSRNTGWRSIARLPVELDVAPRVPLSRGADGGRLARRW